MTDSRIDLTRISLRALLLLAFRAKGYELVGPDWLAEARVTIQGTLPAGATRRQVPDLLQRLLTERFHLACSESCSRGICHARRRRGAVRFRIEGDRGIGLRLERRRSPIDIIVVDSIDRTPTEN
jgi:hypothetical protein